VIGSAVATIAAMASRYTLPSARWRGEPFFISAADQKPASATTPASTCSATNNEYPGM